MAIKVVAGVVVGIICYVGLLTGGYFIGKKIHFRPPVDCKWQNWGPWSECSQQCGVSGTQHRIRSYSTQAEYGGIDCYGKHFEKRRCNVRCENGGIVLPVQKSCICKSGFTGKCCECKVKDCKMSQWSDWSTCSRECGSLGTRFRTRNIDQTPECGGTSCTSSLTEQQPCNRICYNSGRIEDGICKCPSRYRGQCCECKIKHCELTQWSDWSPCSHACGPLGTRYKLRDIQQSPECGGRTCPSVFSEQQPCNRKCYNGGTLIGSGRGCRCSNGFGGQCCDVNVQDCAMIPWSQWSSCSHTCGPLGKRFRIRDIDRSSVCEQNMYPSELSEEQSCNRICQNGGTLSERRCNCPIEYNGTCCECKIQDCVITSWSDWSTCSERCGDLGTRFRTRVVDKFPECGGIACTSELTQQQPCNKICFNGGSVLALAKDCRCPDGFGGQCCDINVQNCAMIHWNQWSQCSHTCGPLGKQYRTRDIDRSSVCGQSMLPSLLSEKKSCNQFCLNRGTLSENRCDCPVGYNGQCCECKIQNCIMNAWSEWSTCSEMCGAFGRRFRIRDINQFPECGGAACTSVLTEQQPCNRICFNGGQVWPGSCNCPFGFTGKCCECEIKHCEMTEWNEWSPCSHSCGPIGTQFRVREILQLPECGGRTCQSTISEQQPCNKMCYNGGSLVASEKSCRCPDGFTGQCCDVRLQDCAMSPWSQWSSCSHTCGPLGKQFRTRDIDRSSVCGQTMFPSLLSEEKSCNLFCLNRGSLSESRCDCPDGYSGQCCECKIQDCVMSVWSEWSACSKKCGPLGEKFRTRNVIKEPACGRDACPINLTDQRVCNQFCYNSGIRKTQEDTCSCQEGFSGDCCECENVDCSLSEWSDWSSCQNATRQIRSRDLVKYAKCAGKRCDGSLTDERSCAALLKTNVLVSKAGIGVFGGYAVLVTYMFGMAVLYFFRKHKKKQDQTIQNNSYSPVRTAGIEMEQESRFDQNDECESIGSVSIITA